MVSAGLVEYEKDEESQALLLVVISTQGMLHHVNGV